MDTSLIMGFPKNKKVKLNSEDSQSQTVVNDALNTAEQISQFCCPFTKVINLPSLRERFEGVVEDPRNSKFSHLVEVLSSIDQTMFSLKARSLPTFWSQVQRHCALKPTTLQLQQILSVWSAAFSVSYGRNEENKSKEELHISYPEVWPKSHVELRQRRTTFQQMLDEHVTQNGDYIELYPLPQQKEPIKQEKPKCVIFDQLAQMKVNTRTTVDIAKIGAQFKSTGQPSALAQKLIERIRTKQQIQQAEESDFSKWMLSPDVLTELASKLYYYYSQRDVCNMFYENVKQYVIQQHTSLGSDKVDQGLQELMQKTGDWLREVQNPAGKILRMNRTLDFPSVVGRLREAE